MSRIADNTPNQANYLCSPMQRASLNSPKSNSRRKVNVYYLKHESENNNFYFIVERTRSSI